jgi:hypothetical protein
MTTNMTTKEKAKQLYNDFGEWIIDTENCTDEMNKRFVKQVLTIHLLEQIKEIENKLDYYHALIEEVKYI